MSGSDLSPSDLRCLAGAKPVEENKKALAKALADRIVAADQHIQNDMYGSRYEFNILSEYGYTDIALKAVTQTGLPGYVHRITQGTTSLWEQWTDRLPVNHHYRSNVATWFYQSLAGTKPTSTAYESLRIRPFISSAAVNSRVPKDTQDTDPSPAMLSHVSVSIDTVRGKVCPEWHRRPDGRIDLTVTRPVQHRGRDLGSHAEQARDRFPGRRLRPRRHLRRRGSARTLGQAPRSIRL
ncbi:alpha-L-rhamnosidase-related protein [Streptomyces sp. NBC_01362]|uniref:alpha-L-rhamnosidase-related protein n=1 Tax=Streptomyces sp. NBC_01362 TaxID=2903839 RepID=UPI003FCDDAD2